MATCPLPKCGFVFDDPALQVTGSAFSPVTSNAKCEQNIVYMTDDEGLNDLTDATLGKYLTADSNMKTVTFDEVISHFKPCSCVYRDLICFFNMSKGEGSRPASIKIGLVESGDTLSQSYTKLNKCPSCAWQFVVASCKADGTSTWIDSSEYLDFLKLVSAKGKHYAPAMTYQAKSAFSDVFETTSYASQAAAAGIGFEFVVASYTCDVIRDASCEPVLSGGEVQPSNYYNNSALLSASIAASYSTDSQNYNFTKFRKPNSGNASCENGYFLDETTSLPLELDQSAMTQLTGINPDGNLVTGATRHLSAFLPTSSGTRYFSSLGVDGSNYGDVWFKEKAINDAIKESYLAFLDGRVSLGLTLNEARLLASQISLVLNSYINKGVIADVVHDWSSYPNIIRDGGGYVIAVTPLSELSKEAVDNRNGYAIQACFVVNTPQHVGHLSICELPVITGEEI